MLLAVRFFRGFLLPAMPHLMLFGLEVGALDRINDA